MLPPCVGMMSVSTALISDEIVRVSVVSGVTVNACVENTTSAVCPAARRSSKSSSFSFARARRDGSTSPAFIERDRSSATTRASSERNAGTGKRSHVGPASPTMPTSQAASAANSATRLSRSTSGSASTCGRKVGSTTLRQPPLSARPRKSCQISHAPTGRSSSQSGRRKWNSATREPPLPNAEHSARQIPARRDEPEHRRGESYHDGCAERPVEELRDGPEAALVGLGRLELVENLVDL